MRVLINAWSFLGQVVHVEALYADEPETGATAPLVLWRRAIVPLPADVARGTRSDRVALVAEEVLSMCYDRGAVDL